MEDQGNTALGIVILVGCALFILGVPATLFFVFRRRRQRADRAIADAWSGVVTATEIRTIRVGDSGIAGGGSATMPYLEVSYRRDDGRTGTFAVGDGNTAFGLMTKTMQPLPPDGLYDEVMRWKEGDRIVKDAGTYYPRRAPQDG